MAVTIEFKGTAKECLEHFLHTYSWQQVQAYVAEFSGVGGPTVRRWYIGSSTPQGMESIRLRVMLNLLGYKVKEFDSLPALNKRLTLLLVFGVLTIEEAMAITGHVNKEGVRRQIRDGSNMAPELQFQVNQKLGKPEYTEALELKIGLATMRAEKFLRSLEPAHKDESSDNNGEAGQPEPDDKPEAPAPSAEVIRADKPLVISSDEDDLAYALVDMLKAVASLAKAVEGSPSWPTQKHYVRITLERDKAAPEVIQFLERLLSS